MGENNDVGPPVHGFSAMNAAASLGVVVCLVIAGGCSAQSTDPDGGRSAVLSGQEIRDFQNANASNVSSVVTVGNQNYAIPQAPYVRLAEIGRGTSSAYYQAWLTLRKTNNPDASGGKRPDRAETVTVSIGFQDPGNPGAPHRDEGWTHPTSACRAL